MNKNLTVGRIELHPPNNIENERLRQQVKSQDAKILRLKGVVAKCHEHFLAMEKRGGCCYGHDNAPYRHDSDCELAALIAETKGV